MRLPVFYVIYMYEPLDQPRLSKQPLYHHCNLGSRDQRLGRKFSSTSSRYDACLNTCRDAAFRPGGGIRRIGVLLQCVA